jgi:hypothetical protein
MAWHLEFRAAVARSLEELLEADRCRHKMLKNLSYFCTSGSRSIAPREKIYSFRTSQVINAIELSLARALAPGGVEDRERDLPFLDIVEVTMKLLGRRCGSRCGRR